MVSAGDRFRVGPFTRGPAPGPGGDTVQGVWKACGGCGEITISTQKRACAEEVRFRFPRPACRCLTHGGPGIWDAKDTSPNMTVVFETRHWHHWRVRGAYLSQTVSDSGRKRYPLVGCADVEPLFSLQTGLRRLRQ